MRVDKNRLYLIACWISLSVIASALLLFGEFIFSYKDNHTLSNPVLLSALIIHIIFIAINSFVSIVLFAKKYYNVKREKSAILMGIFCPAFLFTPFVYFNAYNKSGLSRAQKEEAIKIIMLKNMRKIIKRKEIKEFMKSNKEFANVFENIITLRDRKYESEIYSNENLYDLLKAYNVNTGLKITNQEIVDIGKYL